MYVIRTEIPCYILPSISWLFLSFVWTILLRNCAPNRVDFWGTLPEPKLKNWLLRSLHFRLASTYTWETIPISVDVVWQHRLSGVTFGVRTASTWIKLIAHTVVWLICCWIDPMVKEDGMRQAPAEELPESCPRLGAVRFFQLLSYMRPRTAEVPASEESKMIHVAQCAIVPKSSFYDTACVIPCKSDSVLLCLFKIRLS